MEPANIPAHLTFEALLARAKMEIEHCVREGRVPRDCRNFSALHDYVDANEFGGFCEDTTSEALVRLYGGRDEDDGMPDGMVELMNNVQRALDDWICGGALMRASDPQADGRPTALAGSAQVKKTADELLVAARLAIEDAEKALRESHGAADTVSALVVLDIMSEVCNQSTRLSQLIHGRRLARRFDCGGSLYTYEEMREANSDDANLLEWLDAAAVGEVFPAVVPCRRVA